MDTKETLVLMGLDPEALLQWPDYPKIVIITKI